MSRTRDLGKIISGNFDVPASSLDNVTRSNISDLGTGALSNRNILINGNFRVSQRGNYTSATAIGNSHTYYLDRWKSRANTVSGTLTHSTGYPFTRSLTALLTATSTGTGYMQMDQLVETNYYQGQTLILSAWIKSNNSNARIGCYTGTWSDAATHSGGGSWEKLSVSFTVGTGYATPLIRLGILSAGSWDVVGITSGDYIEVSEVQLEVGDTATPFEHRSYGDELAKCERYYERLSETNTTETLIGLGMMWGSSRCLINLKFNTEKRTNPTVSFSSSTSNHVEILNNSGWRGGTSLTGIAHQKGTRIDMTNISGATGDYTSGIAAEVRLNPAIVNPYIEFDAEL